jgi:hypothetical protein
MVLVRHFEILERQKIPKRVLILDGKQLDVRILFLGIHTNLFQVKHHLE